MRILALGVLAMFVLAGCAGSSDETTSDTGTTATSGQIVTTTPTSTGTGSSSGTTTSTTGAGQNTPPSGLLSASVKTGEAPLLVNFTMDASDADGDDLAWTLDFDGDGSPDASQGAPATFPASREHTFTAAGSFNVTFLVTDGKQTVAYNVVIEVAGAPPAGNYPDPIVWTGTTVSSGVLGCLVIESDDGGAYFYFDAAFGGVWSFTATTTTPGATMTTEWWAGDSHVEDLGDAGTIPATADNVAVCADVPGVPADFVLTLFHPMNPPA